MCMHKEAIQELAEKVGTMEEVDIDEDEECIGAFARARVTIDVTHPLNEMKIPLAVLYERLPDFCFCFGMLGHQYRERLKYKRTIKRKACIRG